MTTLKNVMLINAVSSAATALGLIVFTPFIASLFGISQGQPFIGTGIFLLTFAILVYSVSRKNPVNPVSVRLVIMLDVLWVVVSVVIVWLRLFDLSLVGYVLISLVAVWVGVMAYLQSKGLKQVISIQS